MYKSCTNQNTFSTSCHLYVIIMITVIRTLDMIWAYLAGGGFWVKYRNNPGLSHFFFRKHYVLFQSELITFMKKTHKTWHIKVWLWILCKHVNIEFVNSHLACYYRIGPININKTCELIWLEWFWVRYYNNSFFLLI